MKTKEEVIKEAWGELYEQYKDRISLEDGYLHIKSTLALKKVKTVFRDIQFKPGGGISIFRPKSLQGIENNNGWIRIEDQLPEESLEVLFFNEEWISEDFNPFGTRIGFYNDKDFITAYYWASQDIYETIAHWICDDNDFFSDGIKNSIDPTHWKPINDKPPIF